MYADPSAPPCGAAEHISPARLIVWLLVWFGAAVSMGRRPIRVHKRLANFARATRGTRLFDLASVDVIREIDARRFDLGSSSGCGSAW